MCWLCPLWSWCLSGSRLGCQTLIGGFGAVPLCCCCFRWHGSGGARSGENWNVACETTCGGEKNKQQQVYWHSRGCGFSGNHTELTERSDLPAASRWNSVEALMFFFVFVCFSRVASLSFSIFSFSFVLSLLLWMFFSRCLWKQQHSPTANQCCAEVFPWCIAVQQT